MKCPHCQEHHESLDCPKFRPGTWIADPRRRAASLKRAGEVRAAQQAREKLYRETASEREARALLPGDGGKA